LDDGETRGDCLFAGLRQREKYKVQECKRIRVKKK